MYLLAISQIKHKIYRDIFKYRNIYNSLYGGKYFLNIFSENIFNIYEASYYIGILILIVRASGRQSEAADIWSCLPLIALQGISPSGEPGATLHRQAARR